DSSNAVATGGGLNLETLDPNTNTVVRNPFVPDAIFDDAIDTNGDGLKDINLVKRLVDFGPRASEATRQTFRIVGGFRGDIAEGWNYETFVNYGETNIAQTGTGQINILNYRASQQIISDGQGGFQCADANARDEGCVPVDYFGLNSFTPEMINYLAAPQAFNAKISQVSVGGNVGGELFSITPDDPVLVTFGAEYRKEQSASQWDALQQQGLNGGNALPPTVGEFDVVEGFAEVLVPLVRESFIHDLSVRGAVRISDYSTVGSTLSWNAGGEFAPIEDIRFRAMYAKTVRAPNISELFDGLNQTFPTLTDPCEGVTAAGTDALSVNCRAAPGVNENIAQNGGVFFVGQADRQGISGFTGGNPNLDEEKGETITAGVVINPRSIDALRNLSLSVDYFQVKIEDAITNTPRQFIVNQCYQAGNQDFCDFITRRSVTAGLNNVGALEFVNTGPSNSGGEEIQGIDAVLTYRHSFPMGDEDLGVNLRVAYTHLLDHFVIPLPGSDKDNLDGEVGNAKDRFNVSLVADRGPVQFSLTGTYIGESFLDDQFTGVEEGEDDAFRLHPEFYLDTQIRFAIAEQYEFYVGVDNLLNNDPIYTASVPGASTTGQDANTGVYDPLGRRYYAGVKLSF
ncbi:TonB-dependent receptor, partial [Pacificimonas sp. WHA3]